jgi:hypothetical protein
MSGHCHNDLDEESKDNYFDSPGNIPCGKRTCDTCKTSPDSDGMCWDGCNNFSLWEPRTDTITLPLDQLRELMVECGSRKAVEVTGQGADHYRKYAEVQADRILAKLEAEK